MILYFSSTGNCKFIAQRLAQGLQDRAVSILDAPTVSLSHKEKLGFVFPTYFWRLPSIVDAYLKQFSITSEDTDPYVYFVATYGTTCGQTGTFVKRNLRSKGISLSASFSVKTVDDWTVLFDVTDSEKIASLLQKESEQVESILPQIQREQRGDHMRGKMPMIAVMGSNFFYQRARRTKHLHVEQSCIGCGRCERECPTVAIQMQNGRPTWQKEKCAMCLHCLHHCPQFSIQYENKTQHHGQYQHPTERSFYEFKGF